jgi:hypothetical protein
MGHQPLKPELIAIIRRFDLDGDAKISFHEFSEGLKPTYPDFLPHREHLVYVPSK